MNEKKKYEIIKKWDDGLINFKKVKLALPYSPRHLYRLKKLLHEKGKDGFIHGNRGRKPKITLNQSLSNDIVHYYKTENQGFNFSHYKSFILK